MRSPKSGLRCILSGWHLDLMGVKNDPRCVVWRAILNLLIVGIIFLPVIYYNFFGQPYSRGFFCNDETIRHPFQRWAAVKQDLYLHLKENVWLFTGLLSKVHTFMLLAYFFHSCRLLLSKVLARENFAKKILSFGVDSQSHQSVWIPTSSSLAICLGLL